MSEIFSKKIKERRKEKKITQIEMAKLLEINVRTYQDYEYGIVNPTIDICVKIADILQTSLDYLTGRTGRTGYNDTENKKNDE